MPIIDTKLLQEWHPTRNLPYTPDDYSPKTTRKAWWKCKNDHEWEARVAHRANGVDCPYCSGRLATVLISDLYDLQSPDYFDQLI